MDAPALGNSTETHHPSRRTLLDAVNACATTARYGSVALSALVGFFFVSIASLTHRDLLLNTPVMLPFMQVQIPLLRFFIFAPIFLLVLHALVLVQHVILRGTIKAFNDSMTDTANRDDPLRLELNSYFFVQVYAGPKRSGLITALLFSASWMTLVLLPVLAFLDFQVAFLPVHDWRVTWAHRTYLTIDLLLLFMMGTLILFPDRKFLALPLHKLVSHPLLSVAVHSTILLALFFSFCVATIPDGTMDRFARRNMPHLTLTPAPAGGGSSTVAQGSLFQAATEEQTVFWITALLFEGKPDVVSGKSTSWFARNLIVMNTDLVPDDDTKERTGEVSLKLRGRDLRHARLDGTDLHRADLTGADLSRASLIRANLSNAKLFRARLAHANLNWADLTNAHLNEAKLPHATLREANLTDAKLVRADLSDTLLTWAKLTNAGLSRANLQRAIASWADMRGAWLVWTDLDDANLFGVDLKGSNQTNWQLNRTVLTEADLGLIDATIAHKVRSEEQPPRHDLEGVWTGDAFQPQFTAKSKGYLVKLRFNESGNGFVAYPSLGCSGRDAGRKYGDIYIFEEKIVEGADSCQDGHVRITVDGGEMYWEWFYTDGTLGATATLKRQP